MTAHYLDQTGSQVYFLNPQQFIQPFNESKNMKTIQSQEHNSTIPAEIFHFIVLKDTNKGKMCILALSRSVQTMQL